MTQDRKIVIFQTEDGKANLEVNIAAETLWLSLNQIA